MPQVTTGEYETILLESIVVKEQPRELFEDIKELADSIRRYGQLQPLLVRKLEDNTYQLVAGERRYQALQQLEYHHAEALLIDEETDPRTILAVQLEENVQRKELTWKEVALGTLKYHMLQEELDPEWTQQQTAQRLGS